MAFNSLPFIVLRRAESSGWELELTLESGTVWKCILVLCLEMLSFFLPLILKEKGSLESEVEREREVEKEVLVCVYVCVCVCVCIVEEER